MGLTPIAAFDRAQAELVERLALVPDAGWDEPSACTGWSVGDLVDHVIGGHAFTAALLGGASTEDALAHAHRVAAGPGHHRRRCEVTADRLRARLAGCPRDGTRFPHPAGDLTVDEVVTLRAGDVALHAWDLAASIGVDDRLDPELVAFVWTSLGDPGPDADDDLSPDLQSVLLAHTGRTPA